MFDDDNDQGIARDAQKPQKHTESSNLQWQIPEKLDPWWEMSHKLDYFN